MKTASLAAGLAALVLAGCAASPTYTLPAATGPGACVAPAPASQDLMVGLAVSGGGSRAALFGAGGMEALARIKAGPAGQSVLEQVAYISAVSGGSMASTWYVLKKPGAGVPMLEAGGGLTSDYQQLFAAFRESMAADYEGPMIRRQLLKFRGLNPAWTARSLAEVLAEENFGTATFADLAARQARGDSPHLLVNTTLYNNGRRVVFSGADSGSLRYDFPGELRQNPLLRDMDPEARQLLENRWATIQSVTPADLALDDCTMKVTSAVVASMSYPPYIGPVTLRAGDQDQYWHVGDGGLADNSGTESLLMVALKALQEGRAKRFLIITLDSSYPFAVGGRALDARAEGFSRMNNDFSRIPSIMEERANAYRAFFLRLAQAQGLLPDPTRLDVVVLRHTDADWRADLGDVPATCREEHPEWKTPADVRQHLAEITTRLHLKSACDRELVPAAAARVVAQNEGRIRAFIDR